MIIDFRDPCRFGEVSDSVDSQPDAESQTPRVPTPPPTTKPRSRSPREHAYELQARDSQLGSPAVTEGVIALTVTSEVSRY